MEEKNYKFHVKLGNFEFEVAGDKSFVERTMTRYEGRFLPKFHELIEHAKALPVPIQIEEPVSKPEPAQHFTAPPPPPAPAPKPLFSPPRHIPAQHPKSQPYAAPQNRPAPPPPPPKAQPYSPHKTHAAPPPAPPPVPQAQPYPAQQNRQEPQGQERYPQDKKQRGGNRSRNSRYKRNNGSTWVRPAPVLPKDQEVFKTPYLPDQADGHRMDFSDAETQDESHNDNNTHVQAPTESLYNRQPVVNKPLDFGGVRSLFDKTLPKTHHEKALVFAYYIQETMGQDQFSSHDIMDCYGPAGADPAGNINQVLNHATRTGFLTKKQRGRQILFSMTSKGKLFVEKGLKNGD